MLTGLGCPLSAFALGGACCGGGAGGANFRPGSGHQSEPLIGVNVVIVGTTTGVSTDINGICDSWSAGREFTCFMYMGYVEKLIKVTADMKVLDVVLEEDSKALDEVIVVAYVLRKSGACAGYLL